MEFLDKPEPIILIDQPMVCGAACARPDIPKKILLNQRPSRFAFVDKREYVCIISSRHDCLTVRTTMLTLFVITNETGRKALPDVPVFFCKEVGYDAA